MDERSAPDPGTSIDALTRPLRIDRAQHVVRDPGEDHDDTTPPLVAPTRLGANLDSSDPELVDLPATGRRAILLGYRGVGPSAGDVRGRAAFPLALRAHLRAENRGSHEPPRSAMKHSTPVVVLHGDSDRLAPPRNVDALRRAFPATQAQISPDAGHGVTSQNRQAIADVVGRFLRHER